MELYTALVSNPVTEPHFGGIYARDTLVDIEKSPGLIVCNTDRSEQPGRHWVLFFFREEEETVDFYDSLGKDLTEYGSEFVDFVQTFSREVISTDRRTQPLNTNLCGSYCLFYAYWVCLGKRMDEILEMMKGEESTSIFPQHKGSWVHNKVHCDYFNIPLRCSLSCHKFFLHSCDYV